jgi:hypothetical protein
MHILAKRVVKSAIAAGAEIDPVEHFDAIARLDRLARAQEPGAAARIDLVDAPVRAGNASLRRLSWGALEWYETRARRWFSRPMLDLALAWAMAHGRRPAAIRAASDPERAARAVTRWAKQLTCSFEALLAAADSLLPEPKDEEPKAERPESEKQGAEDGEPPLPGSACGPMLLRLMRETGMSEPDLLWRLPEDHLLALWEAVRAQDAADRRAADPDGPRDPNSPEVLAFVRFRRASKEFLAAVGADNGK